MENRYSKINIRALLDPGGPASIGEENLSALLEKFSCSQNPDVEYFLKHNAVEFTKKSLSVTHLVFEENTMLAGFFTITVKPLFVRTANISKTMGKKLAQVSVFDISTQSYLTAAYMIAQLGKNYSIPKEKQVPGYILLGMALQNVALLKYDAGGILEFLECEDNKFLLQFYQENQFKVFDKRVEASKRSSNPRVLHQLLKFV